MASIIRTDTLQNLNTSNIITQTNATTITIGASGQNIVIPSGVTFNTASATVNYPAGSISNADIASAAAIATTKLGVGAVLQVVQATYSTEVSTSTGAELDTGLTASITPSSASNKILVLFTQADFAKIDVVGPIQVYLYRGASSIYTVAYNLMYQATTSSRFAVNCSGSFLDSPSSTSAVTYKTRFASSSGASTRVQFSNSTSTMQLLEIKG